METVFRPRQAKSTWVWWLVLLAIVGLPLLLLFVFGVRGPTMVLVLFGLIFLFVDGLILSLTLFGTNMRYMLGGGIT